MEEENPRKYCWEFCGRFNIRLEYSKFIFYLIHSLHCKMMNLHNNELNLQSFIPLSVITRRFHKNFSSLLNVNTFSTNKISRLIRKMEIMRAQMTAQTQAPYWVEKEIYVEVKKLLSFPSTRRKFTSFLSTLSRRDNVYRKTVIHCLHLIKSISVRLIRYIFHKALCVLFSSSFVEVLYDSFHGQ